MASLKSGQTSFSFTSRVIRYEALNSFIHTSSSCRLWSYILNLSPNYSSLHFSHILPISGRLFVQFSSFSLCNTPVVLPFFFFSASRVMASTIRLPFSSASRSYRLLRLSVVCFIFVYFVCVHSFSRKEKLFRLSGGSPQGGRCWVLGTPFIKNHCRRVCCVFGFDHGGSLDPTVGSV